MLLWTSFLMDEVCSDWGGSYAQCCWGFDAGTSTDIAFCGSSGQLSSFSVSSSPLHTHTHLHMHAQTSFGISVFRHHTTMDAERLMNQAMLFFLAPKPLLRTYQTSGSYPQWKTFFLLLCQRVLKLCFLFACSPQVKKQMELCSLIYHALAPLSNVLGLLYQEA